MRKITCSTVQFQAFWNEREETPWRSLTNPKKLSLPSECLIQSWRTTWTGTDGLSPSSWKKKIEDNVLVWWYWKEKMFLSFSKFGSVGDELNNVWMRNWSSYQVKSLKQHKVCKTSMCRGSRKITRQTLDFTTKSYLNYRLLHLGLLGITTKLSENSNRNFINQVSLSPLE